MSLVGFKAANHPQQVRFKTAKDEINDRATTTEVFGPLAERFGGFTVDVAAAEHNTKCERFYSIDDSGLEQSWGSERVWCNPPYSDIPSWVAKAWREWDSAYRPDLIVMLLPANRTEQLWWQAMVEPHLRARSRTFRVEFLSGRIRFLRKGQSEIGPNERPPFGCCLLIWEEPS